MAVERPDKTAPRPLGELSLTPAPADLAPWVTSFVHRDDTQGGHVVVVLPERRMSVQVMIADEYWLREQGDPAWHAVPRIGLWGPRYNWAYGFARHHIKVYAFGLTSAGVKALIAMPMPQLVDQVASPKGPQEFAQVVHEPFENWMDRMVTVLRRRFHLAAKDPVDWNAALHILATSASGAISHAAQQTGMSERQFRRVFQDRYGVPPKQYQRVLRVDRMLRQLHPSPWETDPLIDDPIAFADQPHNIREFKSLTGMTPLAYARSKRMAKDRVLRSVLATGVTPPRME